MDRLIAVTTPDEQERWGIPAGLAPFDPADLVRHAPDAHWMIVSDQRGPVARCSLWWRSTPHLPGHRPGIIGHYAALDASVACGLLQHACMQLAARGCTLALGPMDGNTWRRYRLLTQRGSEPVFFLEPDNPDGWPGHFLDAGFTPIAWYASAITTDLSRKDPRMERVADRLQAHGIRIRPLDGHHLEEELRRIYRVATISFRDNFLYTPIDEAEFLAQCRPVLPYVRPELVLLAERCGHPIGFLFAVPDMLQARPGQDIRTIVIKTAAVLPDRSHAGLGGLLVARAHEVARSLGYTRAVHALMHETNASRNISRHYAHAMRRYALFARRLGAAP
jgi:GNAT superfamily N-acetyltransferase